MEEDKEKKICQTFGLGHSSLPGDRGADLFGILLLHSCIYGDF